MVVCGVFRGVAGRDWGVGGGLIGGVGAPLLACWRLWIGGGEGWISGVRDVCDVDEWRPVIDQCA